MIIPESEKQLGQHRSTPNRGVNCHKNQLQTEVDQATSVVYNSANYWIDDEYILYIYIYTHVYIYMEEQK